MIDLITGRKIVKAEIADMKVCKSGTKSNRGLRKVLRKKLRAIEAEGFRNTVAQELADMSAPAVIEDLCPTHEECEDQDQADRDMDYMMAPDLPTAQELKTLPRRFPSKVTDGGSLTDYLDREFSETDEAIDCVVDRVLPLISGFHTVRISKTGNMRGVRSNRRDMLPPEREEAA